jgi:cadmium resistance protein CadD (predicted permease)
MLTLIAFQFFVASSLPKLSYFTLLDKLIVGSTTLVFLTLLESILTTNLVSAGQSERANRIDKHCRWLFPLLFVAWWVVILL